MKEESKKRLKQINVWLTQEEHDNLVMCTVKYHTTYSKLFRLFLKAAKDKNVLEFINGKE